MKTVNPVDYRHPEDAATLENLKQIPGFSTAMKAYLKIWDERIHQGTNMANKIRLGPNQLPHLYALLPPICETLGINEPEFYLEMDPMPGAYTFGDTIISITVTTGLIKLLDEKMLTAVLAHECGHIACRHTLYHSMGYQLLQKGSWILELGPLVVPLQIAFLKWLRCAELSCDRAAAIFMRDPEPIANALMRLTGGNVEGYGEIDMAVFRDQAKEYEDLFFNTAWDKLVQFYAVMKVDHPFLSVRVSQIDNWCKGEQFTRIIKHINGGEGACVHCGMEVRPEWKFCKHCGKEL
jgi:Zn-dependent protease with chaperone function